ncbi:MULTISPECIES: cold shock domain-containing protein [Nocardia]|uniref:cold shock domain-containing protein n=1 Tax=Nocardia TaxID=1817 RepID=UPI00030A1840|nr:MULTISPECIES: cold shock domain-containing protein [Nocardia]
MTFGTVKWFNHEKGFGFITSDLGPDLLVRQADIHNRDALLRDQRVTFDHVDSPKGPLAQNVRPR